MAQWWCFTDFTIRCSILGLPALTSHESGQSEPTYYKSIMVSLIVHMTYVYTVFKPQESA